jgi:hypothetical protein
MIVLMVGKEVEVEEGAGDSGMVFVEENGRLKEMGEGEIGVKLRGYRRDEVSLDGKNPCSKNAGSSEGSGIVLLQPS